MTKVLLIDDEPLAINVLREYLSAYPEMEIVGACHDGFEGVKAINSQQPDLVFLDIQMPRITGFEMLELVESPPAVIFTTAYDEYALKAFESNAVDYLLKPFSKERLDKALAKFRQLQPGQGNLESLVRSDAPLLPDQQERVVVKINGKIRIIPVHEILFIQAADDYVEIHTAEGRFLKNKTMAYFENSLPAQVFVRVHRSYIVNVNAMTRIEPYEKDGHILLLKNGARIPVSRNGYTQLKQVLGI